MNLLAETLVSTTENQIASDLEGEVVVLNVKDGVYYGLDGVGARVWELLAEPRTLAGILADLLERYEVDAERCEQDVRALLLDLEQRGLVEFADAATR